MKRRGPGEGPLVVAPVRPLPPWAEWMVDQMRGANAVLRQAALATLLVWSTWAIVTGSVSLTSVASGAGAAIIRLWESLSGR